VLAEEVEPILNACHVSFVRRKFQSPLTQELLYQRTDFVDQQIIAVAGDDKVIGITHQMHLGMNPMSFSFVAPETLRQQDFKSIQGEVG